VKTRVLYNQYITDEDDPRATVMRESCHEVLKAIGIPTNMFTVIFALSRTVGWVSHWHEMMGEENQKIGRPRQLYTGYTKREFSPIKK